MLKTTILPRAFYFTQSGDEIRLTDPNPAFSAEQVMNFYSGTYPILTAAKVEGPAIEKDEVVFRFQTTLGTKG